ncbi:MAG: YbaN family protein [Fusobacterium sp.]|nr:YbaN family protein [Fusobacterium sp.]
MKKNVKKILYIIVGSLAVILGTIGIFLPLLPTVPFLLLALFCFNRSSDRFYNFVMNNKYFGKALRDYEKDKSIPKSAKIKAIILLSCSMSFSIYKIQSLHMRIFLVVVWIAVTIHLLMLKTKK